VSDIATGGWRKQWYKVRRVPPQGAHNWFMISEFIAKPSST